MDILEAVIGKPASDPNETREEYVERARLAGLVAVYPADNELFIDIDNEQQYTAFQRSWEFFLREIADEYGAAPTFLETRSQSGNRHILVRLPFAVDTWQRIAWQGALGSDPVRELCSGFRALRNDAFPTLFVEKPDVAIAQGRKPNG